MMRNNLLLFILAISLILCACTPAQPQPTPNPEQVADLVETFAALTLTARSENMPTSTNTPLPTPTETASPTPTIAILILPTGTPIPPAKPEYACDIINQQPRDNTKFRPKDNFDIRWTIVNTGTRTWEDKTYLEYQNGPRMTETKRILLSKLDPGEQQEIILDAVAPSDWDLQVMVWVVRGPGKIKDSMYWMCYPYVRVIVEHK